ncbi:hypothetical protein QR98_0014660 [Sarcoptes scabiei]|uniref:Uncharacterized protein n=1 Tax=Sarcoptes scabiei TaxID=52283 RepID=A0A131ZWK6_SARSC|nr:hypothetical protein QR98_0014660 [Sarcoptes scabiei]
MHSYSLSTIVKNPHSIHPADTTSLLASTASSSSSSFENEITSRREELYSRKKNILYEAQQNRQLLQLKSSEHQSVTKQEIVPNTDEQVCTSSRINQLNWNRNEASAASSAATGSAFRQTKLEFVNEDSITKSNCPYSLVVGQSKVCFKVY